MCWANQRLVAPANSASRQTSSISAVDEKPSKNTPTGINHSLTNCRHAAAGGGLHRCNLLQGAGFPSGSQIAPCLISKNVCAQARATAIGQIALDQFATLLSTWIVKPGVAKQSEGRLRGHKQD